MNGCIGGAMHASAWIIHCDCWMNLGLKVTGSDEASPLPSESCGTIWLKMYSDLRETGPLSQGVRAGRKALKIRHVNGMAVRKKRPKGFK